MQHVDISKSCVDDKFEGERLKLMADILEEKCKRTNCGQTPMLSGRVIGGSESKRGQWPFLVALENRNDKEFFCGGNLISSLHVLTGKFNILKYQRFFNDKFYSVAAHCIQDKYAPEKKRTRRNSSPCWSIKH